MKYAVFSLCLLFSTAVNFASAAIINFDLVGSGGSGLLGSNENPSVAGGGSGGKIGAGIFLDDATNLLTINVGWGSGNGFTDLTGNAVAMHIHDAGTASFTANGGVIVPLDSVAGFNSSLSNGGFQGSVTLTATQTSQIQTGRFYLNAHTAANGGGEIRGNLVVSAVPEPGAIALLAFGMTAAVASRYRRKSQGKSPE